MSLSPIPLFGLGNAGRSVNVNAQQRTNLYCQIERDPERNVVTMYPTPGLTTFVNFGANPDRAFYPKGDYQYHVNSSGFYRVANDGTIVLKGTLLTSGGRCDVIDNGLQIIIVDGTYGYIYTLATEVFVQITDVDFPGAQTVTFLNGYFCIQVPNTGRWYISALYDGLNWNALDFATAESDPDNLVRIMAENGQIVLFGEKTTEFWGDSGGVDFPFARIGASAIEWGLAARWSLCKFMDSLMFLRRNRLGYTEVCMLSGYTAKSVTPPELAYVFSQYSTVENASAFSYMVAGHAMYQINFSTENESWLYDAQSQAWSKVQSGDGRHRGEIQASYLNRPYVSDYENGKIYRLDENVYTDDGEPIAREFISRHQATGDFTHFPQFWLELEAGVGLISGQGSDPQMMMSISRDGGHTYGGEVSRPIGKIGEYRLRAVFNRIGRSRDWLYKFRIVEPIKTVFVAAWGRVTK